MKLLLCFMVLLYSLMAWSQQDDFVGKGQISNAEIIKSLTQFIASTPLSKQDMLKIVDQMAVSKQITDKEAKETKEAISKMSDDEMGQMKKTMIQMMTKQLQSMKLAAPLKTP